MDSRSGQGGVLSQGACVAARLPGAGGLEGQVDEGLSIKAVHMLGMRRDVSGGEVVGGSLVGHDFNLLVAYGHLGPRGFLPCSPLRHSRGMGGVIGVGLGGHNRIDPRDLGLRWKEKVRMMQSYRT